jgi:uncharacterized protein YdhG (YjbR/CyaY superfamily)
MSAEGDRTRFWPAIEAKHGLPMSHWFAVMDGLAGQRYPEQVAFLREEHGFSQAHANALVMFARGSTTSKRTSTLDGYLATVDPTGAATLRAIFDGLQARHPGSTVEIAWNHPFLVIDGQRLLGVSVLTRHLLLAPWSVEVLDALRERLAAYTVNRKTIRLPLDWTIDEQLLDDIVAAELARRAG